MDDAFAVALALQSPELKILGITAAWGNTPLRAKLLARFLQETGRTDIPIAVGTEKYPAKGKLNFSQAKYAERGPDRTFPAAVDFLLAQIRQHPGEITLIAIGPETNLGEADRPRSRHIPETEARGLDGRIRSTAVTTASAYPTGKPQPQPEWNILCDIPAAQKLFTSGIPLYVMPLDSTQIKLQELERAKIFSTGTSITDALTVLYHQWSNGNQVTPTLFDAVAVAYAIKPDLCPTTSLRLRVDEQGSTRVETGAPNAQVCLRSDSDQFFEFYMPRITAPVLAAK